MLVVLERGTRIERQMRKAGGLFERRDEWEVIVVMISPCGSLLSCKETL
jgi:hypothetical protein